VNVELSHAYRLLNYGPTVLVSTTDGVQANACAVAWVTPVSRTPPRFVLAIDPGHKTYENLVESSECVINLPTVDAIEEVWICGSLSGHDGDKLAAAGVGVIASRRVEAPRLVCAVAWIEAVLVSAPVVDGTPLVLVEAVAAEARAGVLDHQNHVDVARFPTLHHLGGSRFALPGRIVEPA